MDELTSLSDIIVHLWRYCCIVEQLRSQFRENYVPLNFQYIGPSVVNDMLQCLSMPLATVSQAPLLLGFFK